MAAKGIIDSIQILTYRYDLIRRGFSPNFNHICGDLNTRGAKNICPERFIITGNWFKLIYIQTFFELMEVLH